MEIKNKNIFWQSLVISLLLFVAGFFLGFLIENERIETITESYLSSESTLEKIKLNLTENQTEEDCSLILEENINLGDEIFREALTFQDYEESGIFTNGRLKQIHRRFDELRTLFWIENTNIRERCSGFHTVVYLYDYLPEETRVKNMQKVASNFLVELKKEQGSNIVLIPIAKNLDIEILDARIEEFEKKEIMVIVDEKVVISSLKDLDEIGKLIS